MHAKLSSSGGYSFHLTVVYSENSVVKRHDLWEEIKHISEIVGSEGWLMGGDFNEIWVVSRRA